jgi:hypothetical protein
VTRGNRPTAGPPHGPGGHLDNNGTGSGDGHANQWVRLLSPLYTIDPNID